MRKTVALSNDCVRHYRSCPCSRLRFLLSARRSALERKVFCGGGSDADGGSFFFALGGGALVAAGCGGVLLRATGLGAALDFSGASSALSDARICARKSVDAFDGPVISSSSWSSVSSRCCVRRYFLDELVRPKSAEVTPVEAMNVEPEVVSIRRLAVAVWWRRALQ